MQWAQWIFAVAFDPWDEKMGLKTVTWPQKLWQKLFLFWPSLNGLIGILMTLCFLGSVTFVTLTLRKKELKSVTNVTRKSVNPLTKPKLTFFLFLVPTAFSSDLSWAGYKMLRIGMLVILFWNILWCLSTFIFLYA